MKGIIKIVIALAICAAVIFAALAYMKKSSGSKQMGGFGGPGGASGAPGGASGAPGAAAGNTPGGQGGKSGSAPSQGGKSGGAQSQGGKPSGAMTAGKSGGMPGSGSSSNSANLISVRTLTAEITPLQDYVNTIGEIEPTSSVDVFPDIGGKIQSVSVNLGSYVKKGAALMKVNPSTPGTQYALNTVYAPVSGTVTALKVKQGNTVTAGTAVVTIGNVDELQVTASIPERNVASLKKGLKADITLEAYPGQVFKATVVRLSPVVDSTSRTKSVTLEFDKKDGRINAGMFATVKLYTDVYDGSPVIPETAVLEKSGTKYIYVVNSDGTTVNQRTITLGHSVDGYVQVKEGVSIGEKMIIEGMNSLGIGSSIREVSASK
ncbi:MAG: efflux RND transporter periplasmic adaptor subunit [Treponema sp.]|nr:efflux RND transporter periplasmic adaptor subunit [Treponema sp.]